MYVVTRMGMAIMPADGLLTSIQNLPRQFIGSEPMRVRCDLLQFDAL